MFQKFNGNEHIFFLQQQTKKNQHNKFYLLTRIFCLLCFFFVFGKKKNQMKSSITSIIIINLLRYKKHKKQTQILKQILAKLDKYKDKLEIFTNIFQYKNIMKYFKIYFKLLIRRSK